MERKLRTDDMACLRRCRADFIKRRFLIRRRMASPSDLIDREIDHTRR